MSTAGKIVVRENGKRGVRSTGRVAVFNSQGACTSCCEGMEWGLYCAFYHDSEGRTPKFISVILAGAAELPCSVIDPALPGDYSKYTLSPDVGPNGTFVLEQVAECIWLGIFATEWETTHYSDDECSVYSGGQHGHILVLQVNILNANFPNVRIATVLAEYLHAPNDSGGIACYYKPDYVDGLDDLGDITVGASDSPLYWNRYTGGTAVVKAGA